MKKILNFIQNLFGCKHNVKPIEIRDIPENMLTPREKGKEIIKIPEDEFLCPKCDLIPEIKEVHFYTNKLIMHCKNHGKISRSATDYINELMNSQYNYLKIPCQGPFEKRNKYPSGRGTSMKYCPICRRTLCKTCYIHNEEEHKMYLRPVGEKNNFCKRHPNKAEKYCEDCIEIICDEDIKYHEYHKIIDTKSIQKEANKAREKINDKIINLYNALKLFQLVNKYGNDDAKKNIEEIIKKENERNDTDVDLAIYYLEKHGNELKNNL